MSYEYWLDMIQFFEEIADRFILFSFRLMSRMIEQGTQIRIGDIDVNELFEKIREKKHMKVISK